MASLTCGLCGNSLIRHIFKQEKLMRSILDAFVENGHIYFDELVDKLIVAGILQTKNYEILTVPTERGHRARKLWSLLLRLPPSKFKEHVEPMLQELGFFQDQKSVCAKTHMCLRCVMEHMLPVEELADKLVTKGCLKQAVYRDAVKSSLMELDKWRVIFDSLRHHHADPEVVEIFENLLKDYEIPVPKAMAQILDDGVLCACSAATTGTDSPGGERAGPPTGLFCEDCERLTHNTDRTCRCRPNIPCSETSAEDDEVDDVVEVELRPRSCRQLRKTRMLLTGRFQRDVFRPMVEKRVSG